MSAFPLLSRSLSRVMFNELLGMLPPLADDSIEALIARDGAALAGIDALGPIRSAEEASLAVTVIVADSHARDAFRLAGQNADNLKTVMQCRSQAMLMLRTRGKAVDRLERLQAEYRVDAVLNDLASAAEARAERPAAGSARADGRRVDAPPVDAPPVEASSADAAPVDAQRADAQAADALSADARRADAQADVAVAASEPSLPMSPEERDCRRTEVTAIYAGLAGRPAPLSTNDPAITVSFVPPRSVTPDPAVVAPAVVDPAIIAWRVTSPAEPRAAR